MIALLQRVREASVSVDGVVCGRTGPGYLALVCAEAGDTDEKAVRAAEKTAKLRVFEDDAGRMNRSILDAGGSVLVVSQFTLAADTRSGNRPGFSRAAPPEEGERLVKVYVETLRTLGLPVETGVFGAHMAVSLVNDGPATFWIQI